jgi:hypothetical protein
MGPGDWSPNYLRPRHTIRGELSSSIRFALSADEGYGLRGLVDMARGGAMHGVVRVQRGGSFLCSIELCTRYLPGARGNCEPDNSASHIGFRRVRNDNAPVRSAAAQ